MLRDTKDRTDHTLLLSKEPLVIVKHYAVTDELGISVHTLRKARRKARSLPFFEIGGSVRYNLDQVKEALDALEVGGPKPVTMIDPVCASSV